MILPDRISKAVADAIRNAGVLATVQGAVEPSVNETTYAKIVSHVISCSQKSFILKGLYDVIGEVTLVQSIDDTNADVKFREECERLREILSDESLTVANITANDSYLHIYNRSWQLTDMQQDAGDRGFKATFSWKALVRDTLNT